ncbi:cytochrome c oxidase assembly protein COX18, mitochondrial [Planococcus citri]|uniref:cytochrome c oxidase assembly protein COX18, mitochondrial n=1 Tax=Planococcus citri TaxID=170843 RepID=UPI0031F8FA53
MNLSRLSAVCLKPPIQSYTKPFQSYRLTDRRFFHKYSNLYVQTTILKRPAFNKDHLSHHYKISARCSSTASPVNLESDSIIRLIAESKLVYHVQDSLVKFHDYTGLSWWSTIIVAAITVRTIFVLPLAIHQHSIAAKLEQVHKAMDTTVKAEVTKLVNDLSKQHNWSSKKMSQEYKRMMSERRQQKIIENNCHPAKTSLIVLIQAPVWLGFSSALRNLVYMFPSQDTHAQFMYLQMKLSSFLWLSNLTIPDPTLTLPICLAIVNLSVLQVNYLARKKQKGFGKIILNFVRCFTLYIAYVSSTVPSAISLYWLTSSCYGLCQNIILTNPKVKKLLGIPITESTRKNPFGHSYKRIQNVFKFFKY